MPGFCFCPSQVHENIWGHQQINLNPVLHQPSLTLQSPPPGLTNLWIPNSGLEQRGAGLQREQFLNCSDYKGRLRWGDFWPQTCPAHPSACPAGTGGCFLRPGLPWFEWRTYREAPGQVPPTGHLGLPAAVWQESPKAGSSTNQPWRTPAHKCKGVKRLPHNATEIHNYYH